MQFISRDDLEARIGADTVLQLFDDDGDGVVDDQPLNVVLDDANKAVESRLAGKGFTRDQLSDLAGDATLRRLAADVALGFAGRRRPEWIDAEGRGRYDAIATAAKAELLAIAQGLLRLAHEQVHGSNGAIVGGIRVPEPQFIFAASAANRRGPGGF